MAKKGVKFTEEHKRAIGRANAIALKGKHVSLQTEFKKGHTLNKGRNNPNFGKPVSHVKKTKYKKIWMKSSWEIAYAKYLDKNKTKWKYEPERFNLGDLTYCPDFYLPEKDLYIEIKGYWRGNGKLRFDTFKQQYPEIKIRLLMRPELKKLEII